MFLVFVDLILIYLFIYLFYFFTKGNIKLGTLIPITKPKGDFSVICRQLV